MRFHLTIYTLALLSTPFASADGRMRGLSGMTAEELEAEVPMEGGANYDVVVLGGGFSGLYTAMRIGQASGGAKRIAVVEAKAPDEDYKGSGLPLNGVEPASHACLGGRIQDYPFDCTGEGCLDSGKVWFGMGPIRYKSSQGSFFLAQEFGFQDIEEEGSTYGEAEGFIGHNRGTYFSGGFFGGGQKMLDVAYDTSDWFSDSIAANFLELFSDDAKVDLCNREENCYHDIRQYINHVTRSSEGYEAMEGALRFKSMWPQNDAQGMLEWLDTDAFKSDEGWAVYPEGGMSEFIRAFHKEILSGDLADIYCGAKVESVEKNDDGYTISTADGKVMTSAQIVNTIPQANNHLIKGNVFDALNAQKQAHILHEVETVTCTAQYESRWWAGLIPAGQEPPQVEGPVDTWYSTYNCIQQIEDFNSDYMRPSNTVRVVYADESQCARYWKNLIENTDEAVVAKEIQARLSEYFGTEVPEAQKVVCKVYSSEKETPETAWHFLGVGAVHAMGNNPSYQLEQWAMQPMEEYEDFFMCGEGYTVRHGWVDGCRANCDMMLHEKMGIETDYLPQFDFSVNTRGACSAQCAEPDVGADETCEFPERAILKS